jgi:hypothetical protein
MDDDQLTQLRATLAAFDDRITDLEKRLGNRFKSEPVTDSEEIDG